MDGDKDRGGVTPNLQGWLPACCESVCTPSGGLPPIPGRTLSSNPHVDQFQPEPWSGLQACCGSINSKARRWGTTGLSSCPPNLASPPFLPWSPGQHPDVPYTPHMALLHLLQLQRAQVQDEIYRAEDQVSARLAPSGGSMGEAVPCLFWLLEAAGLPWLVAVPLQALPPS